MASSGFGMRPGIILLREGTDTSQVCVVKECKGKNQYMRYSVVTVTTPTTHRSSYHRLTIQRVLFDYLSIFF